MTGTAKARAVAPPQRVDFVDEGVAVPGNAVPILASIRDPRSAVGEELRLLRANLQAIRHKRQRTSPLSCIAVVSALPGEGKSTVSLGLAAAMAREPGRRILLIEGDLRRPALTSGLGLEPRPGLGEWLQGALEEVPVRRVDPGGFYLLSAGNVTLERPEELGSSRMDAILRAARDRFEAVILDATPILPVADVVLLQDLVDGFLLVVRSRMTPRAAILDALGRIREDKVVGIVLNDQREYRRSYMSYAYDRYSMYSGSAEGSPRPSGREGRRARDEDR